MDSQIDPYQQDLVFLGSLSGFHASLEEGTGLGCDKQLGGCQWPKLGWIYPMRTAESLKI